MMNIQKLREYPALLEEAAGWFARKWGFPEPEYRTSMEQCIAGQQAVPQWYIVADERQGIIAGAGVIENDFHDRPDLRPNLCALYVEEPFRGGGIAGEILSFVRMDMAGLGVKQLYLVTDHTDFYERYGWNFLTMVCDASGVEERMYTIDCV